MAKLKLNVDELAVVSFVLAEGQEDRGTIEGRSILTITAPEQCQTLQFGCVPPLVLPTGECTKKDCQITNDCASLFTAC